MNNSSRTQYKYINCISPLGFLDVSMFLCKCFKVPLGYMYLLLITSIMWKLLRICFDGNAGSANPYTNQQHADPDLEPSGGGLLQPICAR